MRKIQSYRSKSLLFVSMLVLIFCFGMTAKLAAQETSVLEKIGFGVQIAEQQDQFAILADLGGPVFFDGGFGFRVVGGVNFAEETWLPYGYGRFGLVGSSPLIGGMFRCYGTGGLTVVFASGAVSPQHYGLGGFGSFGFEFHLNTTAAVGSAYFIEMGGQSSPVEGKTNNSLLGGFFVGAGYRVYF